VESVVEGGSGMDVTPPIKTICRPIRSRVARQARIEIPACFEIPNRRLVHREGRSEGGSKRYACVRNTAAGAESGAIALAIFDIAFSCINGMYPFRVPMQLGIRKINATRR